MGILTSFRKLHIHSNKNWTNPRPAITLPDSLIGKVYFPLVSPRGTPSELFVNIGDQVKVGTKLGVHKDWYVPFYSSVSGKVVGKEQRFHQSVGRVVEHLVIENDFLNTLEAPLPIISVNASKEEIVGAIKEAGIVGMGGAGFPTFMKYAGVVGITDVLINGVECEPYLMTDYAAMSNKSQTLINGIELLLKASGAKRACIAIKKNKIKLIQLLQKATLANKRIKVVPVPDQYPMGYERTLIQEVYKRDYNILPKEVGVIVNNSQTAIAVAEALLSGKQYTRHFFTVAGDGIKRGGTYDVPNGAAVDAIIRYSGGYTAKNITLLPGGPMCARASSADDFVIIPALGGITVLKTHQYQPEPCLRCGTCTRYCPLALYPVEIMNAVQGSNEKRLRSLETMRCSECGICSYVCPSKIDVTDSIKKGKAFLRAKDAAKAKK